MNPLELFGVISTLFRDIGLMRRQSFLVKEVPKCSGDWLNQLLSMGWWLSYNP